jgi:hypothetical protein
MAGFAGESRRRMATDFIKFPAYADMMRAKIGRRAKATNAPQAVGDVTYHGEREALADCDRLRRELGEISVGHRAFVTAPSPGIIATTLLKCALRQSRTLSVHPRPGNADGIRNNSQSRIHPSGSSPLTVLDVPISSIRSFTGEIRSQRCGGGRSELLAEGAALGGR